MAFGIYVHIPYCLQRCSYCDFATYEQSQILPSAQYVNLLLSELSQRAKIYGPRPLDTLYFGGGTPSLLPASEIISLIKGLAKHGYPLKTSAEVTIEINPATVDPDKLTAYLDVGINRFSVGAQTFDDKLLKMVRREHNARQTRETLELLNSKNLNFSFDLLFALPQQSLDGVRKDVEIAIDLGARHISPYCLTVPDGHPNSTGRAPEDEQVDMFDLIRDRLNGAGYLAYEISNFAKPGFESQHNLLYWTDQEYWGLGLSAHSYSKSSSWGTRFWNPKSITDYEKQIVSSASSPFDSLNRSLPEDQFEELLGYQALTDFCHTSLRLMRGLRLDELQLRFPSAVAEIQKRMEPLKARGLVQLLEGSYSLTNSGVVLSNHVFREMTFLRGEIHLPSH